MNLLAFISGRVWAEIIAAIGIGCIAWGFIHHEREIGAARAQAQLQHERQAVQQAAAKATAAAASETQRREVAIQEVVHATQQAASAVAADASAAARERDALRMQLRAVVASSRGSVPYHPASSASSPAAGPDAAVLAELLRGSVDRNLELARIADERGIAGSACERYADALSR
jgi:hypothetical protein